MFATHLESFGRSEEKIQPMINWSHFIFPSEIEASFKCDFQFDWQGDTSPQVCISLNTG